ncbi:hypothetical protein HZF36_12835, partial [Treponema socranskii]|uniref:hypothetical protein n=1 Tax=Treponema socranskii TaxID=53419 RepID=UPI003D6EB8E8
SSSHARCGTFRGSAIILHGDFLRADEKNRVAAGPKNSEIDDKKIDKNRKTPLKYGEDSVE